MPCCRSNLDFNLSTFQVLKIRSVAMGDLNMRTSNLNTILQLKEEYLGQLKKSQRKGATADKLRMFCLGKELKDDLHIFSYDIKDDMTI